jgi:hypothetical protein
MKVFHQDRARSKRIAVGVLAASMLASVLGLAPTANAAIFKIEVEGCDAEDLVDAVEQANTSVADVIVLDDKCKYEFENPYFDDGPGEFTTNALPVIIDDLTIYGNKSKVVGGDDESSFRFMTINGAASVTIRDLTISSFELSIPPSTDEPAAAYGGAILNLGADLTLRNSTVKDNEVNLLSISFPGFNAIGGGIASVGGSTTLRSSTVSGNEVNVLNLFGDTEIAAAGGVYASGAGIDVASSTIKGNKVNGVGIAADGLAVAGGLVVEGLGAELTMDKTTVSSNSASAKSRGGNALAEAGGIYLAESNFAHEIARSTITGNRVSAEGGALTVAVGGGVLNTNESTFGIPGLLVDDDSNLPTRDLTVDDDDKSTISNNKASCEDACIAAGGGYVNTDIVVSFGLEEGDAEFNRTVFKGNVADGDDGAGVGGGLAIVGDEVGAPELVLIDAKVTKNTAKGAAFAHGGGVFADDPANVDLDESDIHGNKPDQCWAFTVGEFCDFS